MLLILNPDLLNVAINFSFVIAYNHKGVGEDGTQEIT